VGASLEVLLVDWQPLVDEERRIGAEYAARTERQIANLQDRFGLSLERAREKVTRLKPHRSFRAKVTTLEASWRDAKAAAGSWHVDRQPIVGSWFAEYPGLDVQSAGKKMLAVNRLWITVRSFVEGSERERFDPFFRRIGWNPKDWDDDLDDGSPPNNNLYCDLWVACGDEAKTLVLSPGTIVALLASWHGDLVHHWESLRRAFDQSGKDYFGTFEELTKWVFLWIEAFEAASGAHRALVAVLCP
jgi:hypothetical protein